MARACRLRAPTHTRISAIKQRSRSQPQASAFYANRQFSQSTLIAYPRKDSQDKDSINTEATEYSKSASDDEGARQEDAAFDPNITDPQQQKDVAGKGLSVSSQCTKVDTEQCFENSKRFYLP
ncbi:hypothetical protein MMC28_001146 [Mycoblastus sanguinarius]|nr:hypothetical protein [Mycoblastus sanguinarius]